MRRLSMYGSGSDSKNQLKRRLFIGMDSAVGICTKMLRSLPPPSMSSTRTSGSSLRRAARMQPAEPAPAMT